MRRSVLLEITRAVAITVVAVAGGAALASGQTYEVHDSAGVQVVLSGPGPRDTVSSWTVAAQPILQIGKVEGEEPYLFTRVWDGLRTPDGRLVIVEGSTDQIRVFAPDGHHLVSFGRHGNGPSEFGGPPWIALRSPDTLVAWDPGHYRLSLYNLSGALLSQSEHADQVSALPGRAPPNARVWQMRRDGTLLWTGSHSNGPPTREGLAELDRQIVSLDTQTGHSHDFGGIWSGSMFWIHRGGGPSFAGLPDPFAPFGWAVLGNEPNTVSISNPSTGEVRTYDANGVLRRVLRTTIPGKLVTNDLLQRERDLAPKSSGLSQQDLARVFKDINTPDRLPPIGGLLWDLAGNLWVGRRSGSPFETPRDYDVFDHSGHWLALVEMPANLDQILEVGSDYVLGSWHDQNDVQYIRLYRLEKKSPR